MNLNPSFPGARPTPGANAANASWSSACLLGRVMSVLLVASVAVGCFGYSPSRVTVTPAGPMPALAPKAGPDQIQVFDGEPDRAYRILGDAYYDWAADGIQTNSEAALAQVRIKAAQIGADCLMRVQRETGLGPFAESTVRAKLCVFTGGAIERAASTSDSAGVAAGPRGAFVSATPQTGAYALVIGIEAYRDIETPATGARNDATRVADILHKTLGLKDGHVELALGERATKTDIEGHLDWLTTGPPAGSRIYVYFSGHGAPDTASRDGDAYLLPYDANPRTPTTTGIAVSKLMDKLRAAKAKEVFVFLDACFSGAGGRSVVPPGARPLMRVREPTAGARVALFTASAGSEIAGPAPGEAMGLFTKHLTVGLGTAGADADGDGQITLQELAAYVGKRVHDEAKKDHREQTPRLSLGPGVSADVSLAWGLPTR